MTSNFRALEASESEGKFGLSIVEKKVDDLIAPTWNSSFNRLNLHINLVKLLNKYH